MFSIDLNIHKVNNSIMKTTIILGLIFLNLVMSSAIIFAQGETPAQPSEPIYVPSESAPQWAIIKADEYITSIIGKSYFDQYFQFVGSSSRGGSQKSPSSEYASGSSGSDVKKLSAYSVFYRYLIPYEHGSRAESIYVHLNSDGNIVSYEGPIKPYKFLITKNEVYVIARNNGMVTPTGAEIVYGGIGFQSDTGTINESYVWDVSSNTAEEGTPYVIYINVDSGEVIGRLTQGKQKYVPLGTNRNDVGISTGNMYMFLGFGVIIILLIIIYIFLRKKR